MSPPKSEQVRAQVRSLLDRISGGAAFRVVLPQGTMEGE